MITRRKFLRDGVAAFTGTVTAIKWIFAVVAMAATAAALIALVIQRIRSRDSART